MENGASKNAALVHWLVHFLGMEENRVQFSGVALNQNNKGNHMTLLTDAEFLEEMKYDSVGDESDWTGVHIKVLANRNAGSSRWYELRELIWQENDDKMYGIIFQRGATEYQQGEEGPLELRDVYEVEPKEVTVIKYVKKKS